MFLTVFTRVLSLLGDPKDKQKVNKTKQCNKSVDQHISIVRPNVVFLVVFIVLHQLCFVNATTNPQSSLFGTPSTEKAMVTPETQIYNATSDLGRSKRTIEESLKEKLKRSMQNNNCNVNTELKKLVKTAYRNGPQLLKKAFKEAVGEVFGIKTDTTILMNCFRYFNNQKIQLFGYEAMIEKIRSNNGLFKDIFKVALQLRIHLEYDNNNRSYSHELKMMLPEVVRLVSFSHKVQLNNVFHKEYLYADSYKFSYDLERRQVFTWIKGSPVTQGDWLFEYLLPKDCFYIKNIAHDEYLYAAAYYYNSEEHRRGVFTWRSYNYFGNKGCWKVELDYSAINSIQIKNVYYDEYLIADREYDEDRRQAFTYMPGNQTLDSLWEVIGV